MNANTNQNFKKNKNIKILIFALIGAFCLFGLFFIFSKNDEIDKIDREQVEKITLWAQTTKGHINSELDDVDIEAFIKLYNNSEYSGKHDDSVGGCTPNFTINVCFSDGSFISISDFCGIQGDFSIYLCKYEGGEYTRPYFAKNKELEEFILNLINDSIA